MASMISRRYGAREVRHGPGSALDFCGSFRWASAHALTVMSGSGRSPEAHADLTRLLTLELVGDPVKSLVQLGPESGT